MSKQVIHYNNGRFVLMPISGRHTVSSCGKSLQDSHAPTKRHTENIELVTCKRCLSVVAPKHDDKKNKLQKYIMRFGLDGVAHLASMAGKSQNTIRQWYKNQRQFFDIVLSGCAYPIAINTMEELCRDYKSLCDVDEVDPDQSDAYRRALEIISNSK